MTLLTIYFKFIVKIEEFSHLKKYEKLLKIASILHDIGKIYEYDINLESGIIEYNEQFRKDYG